MFVTNKTLKWGALMLSAGMIISCSEREIPYVAGNTFDKYNALDITYPDATTLNISYEYVLDSERTIQLPEEERGDGWIFREFDSAHPERFVIIHQYPKKSENGVGETFEGTADEVGAVAETLDLGRRSYKSFAVCVDITQEQTTTEANNVMTYISAIQEEGHSLSDHIFVRRYIADKEELDGQQVDLVYVQDVTRFGYDCEILGNLFSPSEAMAPVIEELNNNANRSVEVIG